MRNLKKTKRASFRRSLELSHLFPGPPIQKSKKLLVIAAVVTLANALFTWTEISLIPKNSNPESTKIKSVSTQNTTGESQAAVIDHSPGEKQTNSQALTLEHPDEEQQTESQAVAKEQARQEDNNSKAVVIDFDDRNTFVPMEPEYSLHGKKGSWGWHLLSGEEAAQELRANQYVCNKPFEHCCLGQGRQQVSKMDPHKALWKLINTDDQSLQLGTFGDVLKHYPAGQSQESMCTFAFFGDSLSSDSAMGAVCEALRMGYTLKSCDTSRIAYYSNFYGDDLHYTCDENRYSNEGNTTSSHFLLEKEDSSSCPRVLIALEMDIINGIPRLPPAIVELGGLSIFNWGVHCNLDDGCLKHILSPFLKIADDKRFSHWRFMFREHEPQHFPFPGGVYQRTKDHYNCSDFQGRINNWRNLKVASIIEARNLTKQIDTIPISAALEPLVGLHYGSDCTHYVYDPLRLDVTWDALLTLLLLRE